MIAIIEGFTLALVEYYLVPGCKPTSREAKAVPNKEKRAEIITPPNTYGADSQRRHNILNPRLVGVLSLCYSGVLTRPQSHTGEELGHLGSVPEHYTPLLENVESEAEDHHPQEAEKNITSTCRIFFLHRNLEADII